MWRTPEGNRTLRGPEARLVSGALAMMVDDLTAVFDGCLESPADYGIEAFDELSASARLALIHQVARHLLTPTPDTLPLSAATEAVVGAVFCQIRDSVELEVELSRSAPGAAGTRWRQEVLAAAQQDPAPEDLGRYDYLPDVETLDLPDVSCTDMAEWELLIDSLADRILWDRDYELAGTFVDLEPRRAESLRRSIGIDDDYFAIIAPDARDDQVPALLDAIRKLTHI